MNSGLACEVTPENRGDGAEKQTSIATTLFPAKRHSAVASQASPGSDFPRQGKGLALAPWLPMFAMVVAVGRGFARPLAISSTPSSFNSRDFGHSAVVLAFARQLRQMLRCFGRTFAGGARLPVCRQVLSAASPGYERRGWLARGFLATLGLWVRVMVSAPGSRGLAPASGAGEESGPSLCSDPLS